MSRRGESVSLQPPPIEPGALRDFPTEEVEPDRSLFRVTRSGKAPWWFGSSLANRFDLPEPRGTCYLAEDDLGALLEVLGPDLVEGAISVRFVRERRLYVLRLPRTRRMADLTSRRAARFGVTAEIGTVVPHDLPRAWAVALDGAGFEGLLYHLRHDPAASRGTALFGPRGERPDWPDGHAIEISRELLRRLEEECGIRVLEIPRSDELDLADPGSS